MSGHDALPCKQNFENKYGVEHDNYSPAACKHSKFIFRKQFPLLQTTDHRPMHSTTALSGMPTERADARALRSSKARFVGGVFGVRGARFLFGNLKRAWREHATR